MHLLLNYHTNLQLVLTLLQLYTIIILHPHFFSVKSNCLVSSITFPTNTYDICLKLSKVLCSSIVSKSSTTSIMHPVSSKTSLLKASSGSSPASIPPPGNLYSFLTYLLKTAMLPSLLITMPLAPYLILGLSNSTDVNPKSSSTIFLIQFIFTSSSSFVILIKLNYSYHLKYYIPIISILQ